MTEHLQLDRHKGRVQVFATFSIQLFLIASVLIYLVLDLLLDRQTFGFFRFLFTLNNHFLDSLDRFAGRRSWSEILVNQASKFDVITIARIWPHNVVTSTARNIGVPANVSFPKLFAAHIAGSNQFFDKVIRTAD